MTCPTSGLEWTRDGASCLLSKAPEPAPLTPAVETRMTHRQRRLFWMVFVFATSLLVFVCATRNPQPIDVSVSYLGAENYKHWGLCSYFGITNNSRFSVKRWPGIEVEDEKNGTWATVMYMLLLRPTVVSK
jgi:hypothetical protein